MCACIHHQEIHLASRFFKLICLHAKEAYERLVSTRVGQFRPRDHFNDFSMSATRMPTHFATIKERGLWPSSTAFWIKTHEGYAMPCQGASHGAAPVLNWKTGKTLRAEAWLSIFPNKNNSTLQEYTSRTQTLVSVEQAIVHVFAGPRKRYCNDCNIEREKIVRARCALFWEVVFGGCFSSAQGAAQGTTIDEFQTPATGVGHEMHQFHR